MLEELAIREVLDKALTSIEGSGGGVHGAFGC
jgi:hypothetical protein